MGARSAHARVRGRPEGGGDGFLLPVSTRTSFAGKTVGRRLARASGYPEGGGGASGPLTRPRDGFLLSQERRWNHVVPAQAGTQRGEVERRGLSRAPALDSCFRRKDGGTTSCPRKRVPRGGEVGWGLSRGPRDGFLLSQEWLRGAVVMPVTRRGGSRTTPAKAGVYRSLLRGVSCNNPRRLATGPALLSPERRSSTQL